MHTRCIRIDLSGNWKNFMDWDKIKWHTAIMMGLTRQTKAKKAEAVIVPAVKTLQQIGGIMDHYLGTANAAKMKFMTRGANGCG
jgi:hypothetical protein